MKKINELVFYRRSSLTCFTGESDTKKSLLSGSKSINPSNPDTNKNIGLASTLGLLLANY